MVKCKKPELSSEKSKNLRTVVGITYIFDLAWHPCFSPCKNNVRLRCLLLASSLYAAASETLGSMLRSRSRRQIFPLHRIYAEPFANNPASARVLEKAGFVLEARLKNNVVKDGQILDSLVYAKTK